ncbi:MAG: hypothetical protein N3D84_00535 [Candidatus Woesearchaeota archaeon]|nr:hypothetical protein [Candidatus Woesearchaeota archaeon]
MAKIEKEEIEEIMVKYKERLSTELKAPLKESAEMKVIESREYQEFREEALPKPMTLYEKLCNFSEGILKMSPDKKKVPEYEEAIRICHLNVTPTGVASFSVLAPLALIVVGSLISFMIFQSMFFVGFFLIAGLSVYFALNKLPMFMANTWRMKASNQMVLCIFYVVTFMRHTSNLELAIRFASEHLAPPLSLDLKKVLWDVETEKFESLKESLDNYLDTWKKYNMEFIEAFHLIEASLYEPSEDRRIALLEKSLDTILDETYEKMLHYAQNLKSPMTMLHMLGVILPILGLVILPLVVSFMCQVKWYHLAVLYNITLPIAVYYIGKNILSTRPTGYGDTDISEENPELKKYRSILLPFGNIEIKISPLFISVLFIAFFVLIGMSPLIIHVLLGDTNWDIIVSKKEGIVKTTYEFDDPDAKFSFLGYKKSQGCPPGEPSAVGVGDIVGPFGLGAAILSLLMVIGVGVGIGLYYKYRSERLIKIREKSKELEKEFASALFQLGNRLGDGLPPEIAFSKVAEVMEETVSGNFFKLVAYNITRLGMSVERAIFDPKNGALVHYPSALIESSMKVLTESSKKGPLIAAQAIIGVSRYIKEIHRVDERLKDLMAETISSMTSQIKFLMPAIAGIVIGITSMITGILGQLGTQLRTLAQGQAAGVTTGTGMESIISMFGEGVPTFYFQVIVGFYVVQLIYILTILANGIENGADKLGERYALGKNMIKSTATYVLIAFVVMALFNYIAGTIVGQLNLGGTI